MPLEAGARAPPFELTSDSGEKVRLSDFAGQRLVLFFFPKAATSG
jgi:peroxiredoxin Q/BCP